MKLAYKRSTLKTLLGSIFCAILLSACASKPDALGMKEEWYPSAKDMTPICPSGHIPVCTKSQRRSKRIDDSTRCACVSRNRFNAMLTRY